MTCHQSINKAGQTQPWPFAATICMLFAESLFVHLCEAHWSFFMAKDEETAVLFSSLCERRRMWQASEAAAGFDSPLMLLNAAM